jgi:hypothetical protein
MFAVKHLPLDIVPKFIQCFDNDSKSSSFIMQAQKLLNYQGSKLLPIPLKRVGQTDLEKAHTLLKVGGRKS